MNKFVITDYSGNEKMFHDVEEIDFVYSRTKNEYYVEVYTKDSWDSYYVPITKETFMNYVK